MRINVYSEELTDRVEIVHKGEFTGVRFYMELPVAMQTPPTELGGQPGISHIKGPFVHHAGDDDSAAVTFWGKRQFLKAMKKAIALLEPANVTSGQMSTSGELLSRFSDAMDSIETATRLLNNARLTAEQKKEFYLHAEHLHQSIKI